MKGFAVFLVLAALFLIAAGVFLFIAAPESAQDSVALYSRCTAVADLTVSDVDYKSESDGFGGRDHYYVVSAEYTVNGTDYPIKSQRSTKKYTAGDSYGTVHYNPSRPSEYYLGASAGYEQEVGKYRALGVFAGVVGLAIGFFAWLALTKRSRGSV